MVALIDAHHGAYGVEPIWEVLPIAPSTYYERKGRQAHPGRVPTRARENEVLSEPIRWVWEENSMASTRGPRVRYGRSSMPRGDGEFSGARLAGAWTLRPERRVPQRQDPKSISKPRLGGWGIEPDYGHEPNRLTPRDLGRIGL